MPKKAKIRRKIQSAWARMDIKGMRYPARFMYPRHYKEFNSSDELYLYSCSGKLKSRTICVFNFKKGIARKCWDYYMIHKDWKGFNLYFVGLKSLTVWEDDKPRYRNMFEFKYSEEYNFNTLDPNPDYSIYDTPYPSY